jgi:ketosteroid isomerase-like protein
MSQENVEIVRRGFEDWNTGAMDAIRELYDPSIIWRAPEGWPEPGPYVGREAVMRQLEQLRETWDADSFELISLTDVGDRVAVRFISSSSSGITRRRSKASGYRNSRSERETCATASAPPL